MKTATVDSHQNVLTSKHPVLQHVWEVALDAVGDEAAYSTLGLPFPNIFQEPELHSLALRRLLCAREDEVLEVARPASKAVNFSPS